MTKPKTIGQHRESDYKVISIKQEIRKNLIEKIKNDETLFPEIIGYNDTVIPALCNAILSYHY